MKQKQLTYKGIVKIYLAQIRRLTLKIGVDNRYRFDIMNSEGVMPMTTLEYISYEK